MKARSPSLAPMLRSDTQGRLLAHLLVDPTAEYNLSELVDWTGSSMPTISREVDRVELAGIVTTRKVGPTRLIRVNEDHVLYGPLRQVILGTYGPPAVISESFRSLAGADAVILFGSWAARYLGVPGRAPNDIDVLVIGDVDQDAMHDAAEDAERTIGLPVQATARTLTSWRNEKESFIREVKSRPLVPVLVEDPSSPLVNELHTLEQQRKETE